MFGRALIIVFLAAVVIVIVGNQISRRFFSYSSDAYVTSDVVAVAPTVAGRLATLSVVNDQWVASGAPLFKVDPKPYELALESAKASLRLAKAAQRTAQDALAEAAADVFSANAVLDDARATQKRIKTLFERKVVTQQRLDDINRDLATALAEVRRVEALAKVARDAVAKSVAEVASATAARDLAAYNLSQATVTSPMSGFIAPFTARVGAYLDVGETVLAVVSDRAWRVVVNMPEERLAHLTVGQPVWMTIASQPWRVVRGRVKSVSRGIARSKTKTQVLPYVAPTTEWIRLSRRFPVEISFDHPERLTLFMGADARVFIRHKRIDNVTDPTVPRKTVQP